MFKLIEPMPSPNGTNKAGFFIASPENVQAAYDAMPRKLRQAFDAMPCRQGRDEEENGENSGNKMSGETAVKILDYFTKAGMPPDKMAELRGLISPYCEELSKPSEDEEEEEENGGLQLRPGPSEQRDQEERRAMDAAMRRRLRRERDQRALALDSRAAQSFAERYPETALIRRV